MSQLALIDEVVVTETPEQRRIQFCSGDLSRLDAEDEVDLLVVSAFPGAYNPVPGSLIGALDDAGVSVAELSQDIAVDLRSCFSCWISHPLVNRPPGIRFKRVLCFEPLTRGEPDQLVGDIFRSLAPFVGDTPPVKTVALPLVAAGYQGAPPVLMLRLITEAAMHWMAVGLPLSCLRVVHNPHTQPERPSAEYEHSLWVRERERSGWRLDRAPAAVGKVDWPSLRTSPQQPVELQELKAVFRQATAGLTRGVTSAARKFRHDLFISYAHKDLHETEWLLERLVEDKPDLTVFLDRNVLTAGSAWQKEIYEALDDCRKVVALYSPSYLASKVCLEEYNIAVCRNRESKERVLLPVYLYTTQLPTYMKVVQFWDCREFDHGRIRLVCHELLREIRRDGSGGEHSRAEEH